MHSTTHHSSTESVPDADRRNQAPDPVAPEPASKRIGLTNLQVAEHRRKIAELQWGIAQSRADIASLKAELEEDKRLFPR